MHTVYLLLGANLGDRSLQLQRSREAITQGIGRVEAASAVYETAAWGQEEQPPYLNQVLQVTTLLGPFEVLQHTQDIEQRFGRIRKVKWEARTIDIDVLFYDKEIIHSERLDVPHPYLHKRRFTLEPLNEIAGDFVHPVLKRSVSFLLSELTDDLEVVKLNTDF